MSFRFEGGQELAQALQKMSQRVSRRVVKEALMDAAEPMRAHASRIAPRRAPAPDIADNIIVGQGRVSGPAGGDKAMNVSVGPEQTFFHGRFLEFGTVKMSARPFMRPAFEANVQKSLDILRTSMWRELAAVGAMRSGSGSGPVSGGPGGSTL